MRRYQPGTPRTAIGLVAIALTAVTMTATVLWPALVEAAHASGIESATVLTTADAGPRHVVELQCPPQG